MKANSNYVVKHPVITEESTRLNGQGKYVFKVDRHANKGVIKDAIEKAFNVSVTSVNTMNYIGKRAGRRGAAPPGRRPAWKKAVVTLREGDSIDLI